MLDPSSSYGERASSQAHRYINLPLKLDLVDYWLDCVAAFAQAEVDPTMKDRAGRSALDFLTDHMAYSKPNIFKKHLQSGCRTNCIATRLKIFRVPSQKLRRWLAFKPPIIPELSDP